MGRGGILSVDCAKRVETAYLEGNMNLELAVSEGELTQN